LLGTKGYVVVVVVVVVVFVSGAGETIYDLCARVPLIMSTIYIFE
jgi:hypothetical protein